MITGVYKPTDGQVVFDGEDLTGKPPHAVTERGIGRTFQNIRLFQDMTALENVLVGMHCRLKGGIVGRDPAHAGRMPRGGGRPTRGARPARVLRRSRTGRTTYARNLPYGDQRRLEIARALATRAEAAPARRADRRDEPAGDGASSPTSSSELRPSAG